MKMLSKWYALCWIANILVKREMTSFLITDWYKDMFQRSDIIIVGKWWYQRSSVFLLETYRRLNGHFDKWHPVNHWKPSVVI